MLNLCTVLLVCLCVCLCAHSGSHDQWLGGATEGCPEDAETADEEHNSGVCIHRSKNGCQLAVVSISIYILSYFMYITCVIIGYTS